MPRPCKIYLSVKPESKRTYRATVIVFNVAHAGLIATFIILGQPICAIEEQADSRRDRAGRADRSRRVVGCEVQRADRNDLLAIDAERLAAGGDEPHTGTLVEDALDRVRCVVDDVFAVVDHEEPVPAHQRPEVGTDRR